MKMWIKEPKGELVDMTEDLKQKEIRLKTKKKKI